MSAGEAPVKQAVRWIDERLADDPTLDRVTLVDQASRRFDLSPLEADFLFRHLSTHTRAMADTPPPLSDAQARRVQHQFGAIATAYVTSAGHAGGADLERLVAWGRALAPQRVLDVATGGGHTALAFATLGARVTAFDVTEPMLAAARAFIRARGANVRFVAGDVLALPFAEGTFDVVTCRIAAHHFADVAGAVRQIHRVLRSGGTFLLQDILGHDDPDANAFITEVEKRRDPSHVKAYRRAEWKAFLRAAGLTVMDEAVVSKTRPWDEWTGRTRMSPGAKTDLERFVRAAKPASREAFEFRLDGDRVTSFADRMLLVRAERD